MTLSSPGWKRTCFSEPWRFSSTALVFCVGMSTRRAVWSPAAVASVESSDENSKSMRAFLCWLHFKWAFLNLAPLAESMMKMMPGSVPMATNEFVRQLAMQNGMQGD
jgi:hypothetical protein